jgi:hypothetical protein
MNKIIRNIVSNEYFAFIAGMASIIGIIALFFASVVSYIILGCLVLYTCFITLFIATRYKNKFNYRLKEIGKLQHDFSHEYRYHIAKMSMHVFDTGDAKKIFDMIAKAICDDIHRFFKTILKTDVSVCIKSIVTETLMNNDINTWKVTTLARNTECANSRSQNDDTPALVSENTDFQTILAEESGQEDWFAIPNLEKHIAAGRKGGGTGEVFKNSTPNYIEKYKSVIVVPIRIKSEYVSTSISIPDSKRHHHVIGFLCIDSLTTFDDKIMLFEAAIHFLKAFGDSIYTLFEIFMVKQISNKNH